LIPLILQRSFFVAITILEIVQKPPLLSLATSAALIPHYWSF